MTPAQDLGQTLARIRGELGFPSAHAFYQARDGKRSLRMTFRNYLYIENGKSVPKPERFEAVMAELGLDDHKPETRELAQKYLAAVGLSRIARVLGGGAKTLALAGEADHERAELLELAARQALAQRSVHLSREQWELLADDYEANVVDDLFETADDWFTFPEIAENTGLSPAIVKRAVAALVKAGLAKFEGGRARSALGNKVVEAAPRVAAWAGVVVGLRRGYDRAAADGSLVQDSVVKLRLDGVDLPRLRRHVDQLFMLSGLYGAAQKKTPGSAVYMLRAQLFKIFPASKKNVGKSSAIRRRR